MNDLLKTSKCTLEKVMAGFKCFLIKVKVGESFILFLFFYIPEMLTEGQTVLRKTYQAKCD